MTADFSVSSFPALQITITPISRPVRAAIRHHKHNLPQRLGKLTIRVAINGARRRVVMLPTLPMMAPSSMPTLTASMPRAIDKTNVEVKSPMAKKQAPKQQA